MVEMRRAWLSLMHFGLVIVLSILIILPLRSRWGGKCSILHRAFANFSVTLLLYGSKLFHLALRLAHVIKIGGRLCEFIKLLLGVKKNVLLVVPVIFIALSTLCNKQTRNAASASTVVRSNPLLIKSPVSCV